MVNFGVYSILFLIAIAQPAAAYVDPGAGTMVFQAIMAVLCGLAFSAKNLWWKLRYAFRKKEKATPDEGTSS